jgi:hypothetical protein
MSSESNHDDRVKMNVIDYITITCNLKNGRLQNTSDYMKKCNRLQRITITNYDYPMSGRSPISHNMIKRYSSMFNCNQNYHKYKKKILSMASKTWYPNK